jgi:hypothetical protein
MRGIHEVIEQCAGKPETQQDEEQPWAGDPGSEEDECREKHDGDSNVHAYLNEFQPPRRTGRPRLVHRPQCRPTLDVAQAPDRPENPRSLRPGVEAAGIEPASVSRTDKASTSMSHLVISPGRLVVGNPPTGPAILRCRTFGDRIPSVPSPLLVAATRATGPARERRAQLLIRQRERVRCSCSHLCCSRGFTRPPGPRLAALPENRPRRNQVAPVCRPPV